MTAEGERPRLTRRGYMYLAILGAGAGFLSILPLWWLLHGSLPLWLHVPLTGLNLGVLALGAGAAAVAFWHWQFYREP